MANTKLTEAKGYNINNIIFSKPSTHEIPNKNFTYQRISISTHNEDNTIGDLVLKTERLFSFGISENTSFDGKSNGYVMPICLWTRDGYTPEEKIWTDKFNEIVEHAKNHLLKSKGEIGKWELDISDLKKFNPLYWKKEKGEIIPGTGPTLYCKLILSKKNGEENILSQFYDTMGVDIDPRNLMGGKFCYVRAAIKIESIFIGTKCSLQIKLWEAQVDLLDNGMRRLLPSTNERPSSFREEINDNSEDYKDDYKDDYNNDDGFIQDCGYINNMEGYEDSVQRIPVTKRY